MTEDFHDQPTRAVGEDRPPRVIIRKNGNVISIDRLVLTAWRALIVACLGYIVWTQQWQFKEVRNLPQTFASYATTQYVDKEVVKVEEGLTRRMNDGQKLAVERCNNIRDSVHDMLNNLDKKFESINCNYRNLEKTVKENHRQQDQKMNKIIWDMAEIARKLPMRNGR